MFPGVVRVRINGYAIHVDLFLEKNKIFPVIICGPNLTEGVVEFLSQRIPENTNDEYSITQNSFYTSNKILMGLGLSVGVIFAGLAVAHYFLPNVATWDPVTALSNAYTTAAQTATNAIPSVSATSQAAVDQLNSTTKYVEYINWHKEKSLPIPSALVQAVAASANAAIGSISPTAVGLGVATMVGATAYTIVNIKAIIKKIWEHATFNSITILIIVCKLMYDGATGFTERTILFRDAFL